MVKNCSLKLSQFFISSAIFFPLYNWSSQNFICYHVLLHWCFIKGDPNEMKHFLKVSIIHFSKYSS
uniref:Clone 956 transcribed RNA sequence n=1 Tax=Plectreurys tristis TaxID=33319 RepID=A0A0C4W5R8_PLETR|nr:hypothetical protein [Plectreurys tristis]